MLWKWSFHSFKRSWHFLFRISPDRESFHYGVGNRCEDGRYVLFLDYDTTPLEWIQEEIRLLQENPRLGSAFVFQTKKGYHVIFLEKFTLGEIVSFMTMSTCDTAYKEVPMLYGKRIWVLRSSQKKEERLKYIGCMPNSRRKSGFQERSNAHKNYLTSTYRVPQEDFVHGGNFDNSETVILGYYYIKE